MKSLIKLMNDSYFFIIIQFVSFRILVVLERFYSRDFVETITIRESKYHKTITKIKTPFTLLIKIYFYPVTKVQTCIPYASISQLLTNTYNLTFTIIPSSPKYPKSIIKILLLMSVKSEIFIALSLSSKLSFISNPSPRWFVLQSWW